MSGTRLTNVRGAVRRMSEDAVYRGSTLLLLNTALLAAFGFVFWAVAARLYPASDVGAFSGITAGVGLLGAIGALGLPNTLMRHLATAAAARQLAAAAIVASTLAGGGLCLAVVLALGDRLPGDLDLGRTDHRVLVAAAQDPVMAELGVYHPPDFHTGQDVEQLRCLGGRGQPENQ